ncbi:PREDICTED: olfactory receptor 5B12-like [Nanorana parkeri]|uniref:olfactory receptor 5B12-like n=1 Tax=Nanorana parkeri TaxID=125878 RepID=UPI0008545DED|nr:PREDICTED: olfactory receptor 5B12-like [Nanorana parkeri]
MPLSNATQVTMFELTGLTDNKRLVPFLFILFLMIYMVTLMGNVGMIGLVRAFSSLHTPMYYFLSYLSLVDLVYSSTITPKMLADLISVRKSISFIGCVLQIYFYAALASIEVLLLSSMSYDRYAAICHPLHYVSVMTKDKCSSLVLLSFSVGLMQSLAQTSCVFSLQYCRSNLIDHFYCEIPPLLKLSCSDTFFCEVLTLFFVSTLGLFSLITVLISYILIVSSILQMKSADGRQKAFSTCSSHLMCVSIFFVTVFFVYLRPDTRVLEKQDKVASVFYSVVTPMLNPLIYSLRNQDVKRVIIKAIQGCC